MKKHLMYVASLVCIVLLLAGCGCKHEGAEWRTTAVPVGGEPGMKEQYCSECDTVITTEPYMLDKTHDGSVYTLSVSDFTTRIDAILKQIRPELSCELDLDRKGNLVIYAYWNGAYLAAITPQNSAEESFAEGAEASCPARMQIMFEVNTTQQTAGDDPVPVFDLQFETVQALIQACDPSITAEDAQKISADFLDGGEVYTTITIGDLEYYIFLVSMGQAIFTMSIYPAG